MPALKAVEHENGDVSVGFVKDGAFVPVAGIAAARIGHYVERSKDLAAKLEANPEDAAALEAVGNMPHVVPSSSSKAGNDDDDKEGGKS